ncbi:MAG: dihydroorotase [Deltaproteobacteria bacterium]|jgi:allantoinase|nr:dihydroorotase [Deltaproteobacteria bacterium]
MGYDLLIKNATVSTGVGDNTIVTDIMADRGVIVGLARAGAEGAARVVEAGGLLVMPGCIDSHTHYMDQGFTHRETFLNGTSGAAAGGVTTVIDMPCCSVPSVRGCDNLHFKLDHLRPQAIVDFAMWGGVTGEDVRNGAMDIVQQQADDGVVAFKVYMTPSVPSYPRVTDPEMLECFIAAAKTGLPIGVHCENFAICDFNVEKLKAAGRLDGPAWAEARMILAEKAAIQLCISFSEETGARFHVVHMSTGIGAQLIKEGKMRGLDVTSETCPHYLTLNAREAMTKHGAFAKIAPPLRRKEDNELLWRGLADGSVDFMATDHAPYSIEEEKDKPGMTIWTAFPGIPGTETMVPVTVSEGYVKGRLTLARTVEVLSTSPAVQYGLYPKKGAILPGSDADFTLIDLKKEWTIDQKKIQCLNKYTPLDGMKLTGKVVRTIVRGEDVYSEDKGVMVKPGFGQHLKRQTISRLPRTITF